MTVGTYTRGRAPLVSSYSGLVVGDVPLRSFRNTACGHLEVVLHRQREGRMPRPALRQRRRAGRAEVERELPLLIVALRVEKKWPAAI